MVWLWGARLSGRQADRREAQPEGRRGEGQQRIHRRHHRAQVGRQRARQADEGMSILREEVDTLIQKAQAKA